MGREVIAEMNRLGIMVDLSHPSKGANLEAIRLSKAPVIASHSGVRALTNVSRNMDEMSRPRRQEERRRGADGGVCRTLREDTASAEC